jgi:hypothetical protein
MMVARLFLSKANQAMVSVWPLAVIVVLMLATTATLLTMQNW